MSGMKIDVEADEAASAAAPGRRRGLLVGAVGVLAVVVVAVAWLGVLAERVLDERSDRAEVQRIAEQVATTMTTIGFENADAQIDAILGQATGAFRQQLVDYSAVFRTILQEGKVASTGTVTASAVESLGDGRAVVLVSVASRVTNTQLPDGQVRNYRLAVTLREEAGWLVDGVEFVG